MSEAARIADELRRSLEGDPWHGASATEILRGISAATASHKPNASIHSIWEIVRHMTAWTGEVARRLDGHAPAEPKEGDWPAPSGITDEYWKRDVQALLDAHRRLLERIARLSDEHLQAPPREHRSGPVGSGVSYYVLLHGLAQHHAYHAGQIALLKKMAQSSKTAS